MPSASASWLVPGRRPSWCALGVLPRPGGKGAWPPLRGTIVARGLPQSAARALFRRTPRRGGGYVLTVQKDTDEMSAEEAKLLLAELEAEVTQLRRWIRTAHD